MAVEQTNVAIPCEYVFEQEKNATRQEDSILGDPYDDESSDEADKDPSTQNNRRHNNISKTSKKRRSRYDEDMYALPDPESIGDAKIRTLQFEAKKNKKKMIAWRKTSIFMIGIILMSLGGNIYLAVDKFGHGDKTIAKNLKIIPISYYLSKFLILLPCTE